MTDANPYQSPTHESTPVSQTRSGQWFWWHPALVIALALLEVVYVIGLGGSIWQLRYLQYRAVLEGGPVPWPTLVGLVVCFSFGVICLYAIKMTWTADRRAVLFATFAVSGGVLLLFLL